MGKVSFAPAKTKSEKINSYKVLIVDDDLAIQNVTSIVLNDFEHDDYKIELQKAYSAKEAIEIFNKEFDIAVVLLDVVMEENDSGFKVVKYIREVLKNNTVQIILRTGQPGYAPEKEVTIKYAINDYVEKTDLNSSKLFSKIVTAIRSYQDIVAIKKENEKLKESIDFLNSSQEVSNIGSWEIDYRKNILFSSNQLFKILEVTPTELDASYDSLLEFIHIEDRQRVKEVYLKSILDKKSYLIKFRIACKDTIKNVSECCIHILDDHNEITKSIGTIQIV